MQTLLVTGGAGFIGSCFVRMMLAAGSARIVNLDKLTYAGHLESLANCKNHPQHVFVPGDIADQPLVTRLLHDYQVDAVLNFAAESHVDRSIDEPAAFVQTNVVGVVQLLETWLAYWRPLPADRRDAARLLHISTDEVYGSLGPTGKFTEQTPYQPNSPYSASKAAADHFVRAYYVTYGLPTLVAHCSNNYGPYQHPEKLIPKMILNAYQGRTLPVYGDGRQVRDWLHVEDHCRALQLILQRGEAGGRYHVAADCERTNLDVVQQICRLVAEKCPPLAHDPESFIEFVTDRPGHDRRYALDASRLKRDLGWKPQFDFESALSDTVDWYLDHLDWVRAVSDEAGRTRRLGLARFPRPADR